MLYLNQIPDLLADKIWIKVRVLKAVTVSLTGISSDGEKEESQTSPCSVPAPLGCFLPLHKARVKSLCFRCDTAELHSSCFYT